MHYQQILFPSIMNKYYIKNLNLSESNQGSTLVKCVDIEYKRKPASFGIVYITETQDDGITTTRLSLSGLQELDDQRGSQYVELRTFRLGDVQIADLDVARSIFLDELAESTINERSNQPIIRLPDCVLLTTSGKLILVWFDGKVQELSIDVEVNNDDLKKRQTDQTYLQIRFHHEFILTNQEQSPSYLHILTKKTYRLLLMITKGSDKIGLQLSSIYQLPNHDPASLQLIGMTPICTSPKWILLITSDLDQRFVLDGRCIASSIPNGVAHVQQLVVYGNDRNEFLLITNEDQGIIRARSVMINGELDSRDTGLANNGEATMIPGRSFDGADRDPDGLLPRVPSFEVEEVWNLNLQDIDSIRSLMDESHGDGSLVGLSSDNVCMDVIWESDEDEPSSREKTHLANLMGRPKFLLISYKFHLLVFAFKEQQYQANPFQIVYDESFFSLYQDPKPQDGLGSQAINGTSKKEIDLRAQPGLIHNFRLIGSNPKDCLFNTLFLTQSCTIQSMYQFVQLGLTIAIIVSPLSGACHLIAFKFVSNEMGNEPDNVMQQKMCQSLSNTGLLRNEISVLEQSLAKRRADTVELKQLVQKMSNKDRDGGRSSISGDLKNSGLTKLIKMKLTQRPDLGYLYDLSMEFSEKLQVERVVIASTIKAEILEPSQSNSAKSCFIFHEPEAKQADSVSSDSISIVDQIDSVPDSNQFDRKTFKAFCCIEFWNTNELMSQGYVEGRKANKMKLQILIEDRQSSGHLLISVELAEDRSGLDKREAKAKRMRHPSDGYSNMSRQLQQQFNMIQDQTSVTHTNLSGQTMDTTNTAYRSGHLSLMELRPFMSYGLARDLAQQPADVPFLEIRVLGIPMDSICAWIAACFQVDERLGADKVVPPDLVFWSPFTRCSVRMISLQDRVRLVSSTLR